ncbi:PREDICTED: auxilin [Prunus dulcis]|uniref:PREDICTED: auxilin n=1 Tax=Prunus dulcis TaxID=3755 RepID=A0A5E4E7G6_PRUDU|nr:auxilin-like protein 1 isoform X2 [Prunus dulcis]VVA09758.1 PREDICTED: auxilin [Prunus dulcis]
MENLSHSRHPNRSSSAKMINNGGFLGKTLYDDVYGGPPKFGLSSLSPRMEDYSEIFGSFHASRASSIPVLDVPAVDQNEVFFDVRSSGFDYGEVFGGFNGLDFAVAYDDLVNQSKGGDGDCDSSDEAWTPAESGSLSEGSDDSGKNQCFSNGDPFQSLDGSTEFSISYHTAHQKSNKDSLNGMTHVTRAHVPGYTFVLDENIPSQQTENENPILQVTEDSKLSMNCNMERVNEKHLKKTMSHPPNGSSSGQAFGDNLNPERGYGRNGSHHKKPFVTISDISLRTQPSQLPPPSRPPPIVDGNSEDSGRLSSNSDTVASDGTTGDTSPPFFDVEVDASSSAAVSAAAMKEAMEKAKVQLKSAKELMQRRKEGFQRRTKSGSKKEMKEKERKVGEIVDGSNSMKDDRVQGTSEREDNGMKFAVRKERQKVLKTAREVPESLEDENSLNVAKNFAQEKHGKGSWSSQGSFKIDEASEWQEATQYFELVAIDESRKAFELENKEKILVQNRKSYEHRQKEKATMEALVQQEENDKKVRAAIEEELGKQPREWDECSAKLKAAKEACRRKEPEKKVKVTHEIREEGKNEMSPSMGTLPAESEKQRDIMVEVQDKEIKFKVEQARKQKENDKRIRSDKRLKESCGREDFEKRQEENEKRLKKVLEQKENEKRLKEALEQAENEKRLKKALELQENERKLIEAFELENKKKQKEAAQREENEKWQKEALGREEYEKRQKEAFEWENKKKQKEATQREENEKQLKEALEREEYEKRQKDAHEGEESEQRFEMAHARDQQYDKKGLMEAKDIEGTDVTLKEVFGQVENQNIKKASDSEQTGKTVKVAGDWEEQKVLNKTNAGTERNENGQEPRSVKGLHMEEGDLRVSDETCNKGCNKDSQATQIASKHVENSETTEATQKAPTHEENGEKGTEHKISDTQPEVVERVSVSNDLKFKASRVSLEDLENGENRFRREYSNVSLPLDDSVKKAREEIRAEPKASKRELGEFEMENVQVDEKFKASGMAQGDIEHGNSQVRVDDAYESIPLDKHTKKAGEAGSGIVQPQVEQFKSTSRMDFDHETKKMEFVQEWKEGEKDLKGVQAGSSREENKTANLTPEPVKEFVENKRKTEAAYPVLVEVNSQKSSRQVNSSQVPERKDKNLKETLKNGEKETERLKRERELENDRLRKIEEEREREREREKDRMAVDRATLEAREWAYGEVRERAERAAVERATAEARQRAMAEARERLEKACTEAREKSIAGKAAMEARLKAERAAVERATAEARERAAEKVMAERAAFEARERVQRSVSDKFFVSSRNNGLRHCSSSSDLQDSQFQSTGGSRYPYSSVYAERYEGVEGESAQRCKARLERHARTAERAARALAEKNMRDLLAQREQAERNRLAENLDADVRRWSSGKEGNLRALLSTLQYILGPDSGWQPIPLTDVITAAAVKKAYRKATLCVHPDKLQQRGASIQQKYICEKVFDLLKEAWNKFNSEER